jgi:hypothetical protein
MRTPKLTLIIGLALALISCQKEISGETPEQPGGGTGGGNSNGNRLVKAQQVTPASGDTNIVSLKWDASGRLLEYNTDGVVNTIPTQITIKINRASDGKINTILTKSNMTFNFIDSVVSTVHYVPGTNKLAYSFSTQYSSFLGEINDSSVYTYNSAGKIISKESFQDFFGGMEPQAKQTYEYDANGNMTKITDLSHDGVSYSIDGTTINTFDGHKAAVTLGEECFVTIGGENVSVNNMIKKVTNAVASGTTYTVVLSGFQFNSFDRPTKSTLTVNPIPPGYINNLTYFYQ